MKERQLQTCVAILLIALGISLRLLPHPANFAPIAAIAIFGGAVLPRRVAVWVPLGAMMASDLFIGFYNMMFVTWACYALIALASSYWFRKPSVFKGAVLTLSSSLFFFVVTNFAVWVSSGMYTHSWSGLVGCYTMALPFSRNTLASDLLYTTVLFSAFAYTNVLARKHFNMVTQKI